MPACCSHCLSVSVLRSPSDTYHCVFPTAGEFIGRLTVSSNTSANEEHICQQLLRIPTGQSKLSAVSEENHLPETDEKKQDRY